jgi:hypothetical protein
MKCCTAIDTTNAAPADARSGPASDRRAPGDETRPRRRFADLLGVRHHARERASPPPPAADAELLAARAAHAPHPAPAQAEPSSAPAAGSPPVAELPDVALADLQAASGADGSLLRFAVEDGSLAGVRMAFFLRGDVLDVALEAPGGQPLDRVRALEDYVRVALAARGFELGRFDADGENGRREDRGEQPDGAVRAGKTRRRPSAGKGAGSEREDGR